MHKQFMVSLVGLNRVGVLAAITTALDELSGNLQEMSTTVVNTTFSMIAAVEFPDHRKTEVIIDHIRDVCRPFQVEVSLLEVQPDSLAELESNRSATDMQSYVLFARGRDEAGLLRTIAFELSQHGIDVRNLYSRSNEDRQGYTMEMQLNVPENIDLDVVCRNIEQQCELAELLIEVQPGKDRDENPLTDMEIFPS